MSYSAVAALCTALNAGKGPEFQIATDFYPTPGGNTGVNVTKPELEYLIDWLQGTFPVSQFDKVKQVVESALQDSFDLQKCGTRFYSSSWRSAFGAVLACDPKLGGKVGDRTDAYLELGGKVLGQLSGQRLFNLMQSLDSLGFRASRIDLTVDDYAKTFRPEIAYQAYKDGNVVHFKTTGRWNESGPPDQLAQTFSLGRRGKVGSGKHYNFYDKFLESKGEKDCVRIELSLYGDEAKAAWSNLCLDLEWWEQVIPAYVFSQVDFRDRSADSNVSRCPRLEWWALLADNTADMRMSKPKKIKSFARAKRWFEKQVAPTLVMLFNAIATEKGLDAWESYYWDTLTDAEPRMNDSHRTILRQVEVAKRLQLNCA
jgi:hypothetical protein